ncbi:hypothetical protein F5X97DRAFT_312485 [Nemania serpens]|nr:hypothetical protein F5X97DRAFT_312485 [Nemania serpens]
MIDQTPAAGHTPSYATSWVPPHLRRTSESQPTSSSSQLSEATPEVLVLDQNKIRKLTTLDAREIFYQKDVRVFRQGGADSKLCNGRIVIYELLDEPDGIWELTIEDKKVIRGDVRDLLDMHTDGSKAFFRRLNKGRVESDHIRFSDVTEAGIFMNEVNLRRSQYGSSESTHLQTTIELSPVHDAVTFGTAVERTEKPGHSTAAPDFAQSLQQNSNPICFESPQLKKMDPPKHTTEKHTAEKRPAEEHPAEKLRRCWATIGLGRGEFKYRPRTPPISLTAAVVKSTPATPTDEQVGSGRHDDQLIRLSPYSSDGYSQDSELVKHKPLQSTVAELRSLWEEADYPSGLLSEQQVELGKSIPIDIMNIEQEAPQEKMRMSAAEATRALRDIKIIDDVSVPKDRFGNPLQLPWMKPEDYTRLARKSGLLAMALASSSSPTRSAIFLTSLLHLVEIDEFLNLPLDDQKRSLAALYNIIRQSTSRIVRTSNEISALRSSAEACPEAIKEFNALVKGEKGSDYDQRKPTHQPPAYNSEIVVGGAGANRVFLYGHLGNDSLIGETPQDTTTTNTRAISENFTSGQSSNISGKGPKGLLTSRWASDETEKPEQQCSGRGENIPAHYYPRPPDLGSVGNEAGRIVDRIANSHGRLATLDTMSILADQLGSLSLSLSAANGLGTE